MRVTAEEVMAVLASIGSDTTAKQLGHVAGPCVLDYQLSSGWMIRIFDECCYDFDYLEAVKPPGEDWIEAPEGDANSQAWHEVWEWNPDWDPETQKYIGIQQRKALGFVCV